MTTRKTIQAIKVSATWTPGQMEAIAVSRTVFGQATPLHIRGGRLTINAAISIGDGSPDQVVRAYARAEELKNELEAHGTVHSFNTQAGAAPTEQVEVLPALPKESDE